MIIFYHQYLFLFCLLVSLYRALNKIASLLTVHLHMYWEVTHFLVTVVTVNMGNKVCHLSVLFAK